MSDAYTLGRAVKIIIRMNSHFNLRHRIIRMCPEAYGEHIPIRESVFSETLPTPSTAYSCLQIQDLAIMLRQWTFAGMCMKNSSRDACGQ